MIASSEISPTNASGNIFLDSLTFANAYVPGIQITYVLQGKPGDGAFGGTTWSANGARGFFQQALTSWSAVANVSFVEAAGPYNGVGSTDAYDWIEAFKSLEEGLAGEHDLPHAGVLTGSFASDYFEGASDAPGSLQFSTFVHEIGHGLGLLHSHNDGDEPLGDPTFPGVRLPSDLGDNDLNQGIYSTMTYNSGYAEVGYSEFEGYGWEAGPMAFDVAAVQRLYGANTATNAGNSSFALPQANTAGTYWSCIWDAGGVDTINAGSTVLDSIIDLRAATLLPAIGGGGFVSRIIGVLGGFTIANGVVIENAVGGGGGDRIHGNAASNRLDGGAGYDTVDYSGVTANLVIDLATQTATGDGTDTLVSIESAIGGAGNDKLIAIDRVPTRLPDEVYKFPQQDISAYYQSLDLDYHFSDRSGDPMVSGGTGTVSAQVHAKNGYFHSDYYSFFVENAGPITIDVDNTFGLDTILNVYGGSGKLLASNDDGSELDPGSANFRDSYLVFQNATPGQRLYVEIAQYDGSRPGPETSYDLNISLATTRLSDGTRRRGSVLDGGDGNDALVGGHGDDIIIGGGGFDTLFFSGASTDYQVSGLDSRNLTFESVIDGRDRVTGVARFHFSDGNFNWFPSIGLRREYIPPVIQPIAPLTAAEGGSVQFMPVVSDEDSASWQFLLGDIGGGRLTKGPGESLIFTPVADLFGETDFTVSVMDDDGQVTRQTVSLTIAPAQDAPRWAVPNQRVDAAPGEDGLVFVDVFDPDEEPVTLSIGKPAHGTLTEAFSGNYFYTPDSGFVGVDTFTMSAVDPHGASAQQQVTVHVYAPESWRAFLPSGFAGDLGGDGTVYGNEDYQDVRILDLPGRITFDGSFNRGGDIIRLPGNASDWTVHSSGANAVFSYGDTQVIAPAGNVGTAIAFADGIRSLLISPFDFTFKIGDQMIEQNAIAISTKADVTSLPTGAVAAATERIFLAAEGVLHVNGKVAVYGGESSEEIYLESGDVVLDGSFNKGGDTVFIDRPASGFTAAQSGANLILDSQALDVAIPYGAAGTILSFQGDERTLVYNRGLDALLLGSQVIGTEPIVVSAAVF